MNTLQELKEYTKDLTVLYVEDSSTLLKLVGTFLEKLFKTVYLSDDGFKGLESYKLHKQDIVLTDLTMPNMDGYEMIKNLQSIDNEVKVIVVSAHSDSKTLLDAIHMGISDFVPKPIDNKLLQNALFKIAHELGKVEQIINKEIVEKEESLVNKLDILSQSKTPIEFVNHYRGVPIIHNGYIVKTEQNNIFVHTPFIQTLAIKYEEYTVIESELIDSAIEARLVDINKVNREIKLNDFKELKFSSKKRNLLRVEPDEQFILVIHFHNKKIETKVQDISLNSISLIIDNKDIQINELDEVELTFGITLHNNNMVTSIETNERVYSKGKVFKNNEIKNGNKLVVLFELNKSNSNLLERYIHSREVELITEFKQLKNKYKI